MKIKPTKTSIIRNLPSIPLYGVQMAGGKFYAWIESKTEAARIAANFASDGWPTAIKNGEGETILSL